ALPLTGLRVLELSAAWAGPMAGRILAEFGAEVARIEWRPAEAPEPRPVTAPPKAGGTAGNEVANEANLAALHRAAHHRGKASVAIDLAGEGGRRLLRRLVAECGVLLENFRPGVLEGWGCGYDALAAENPALVMLSMSGFGATGPRSPWRALGSTVEGEAGWCALMGEAEGPPLKHGEALADPVAALNGLAVLLAALRSRDASGRGMHIDLSQAECALRQIGERIGLRSLEAKEPERRGNRHTAMAPHGVYPCAGADRWLAVSVRSGEEWRRLCGALGWGDWAEDRKLARLPGRLGRRDDIDRRLAAWSATRAPEEAQAILDEAGVTCAPVLGVAELRQWAHLSARGGFVELESTGGGMLSHVRTPLTVSGMALSGMAPHHRPAAPYGADTARVLGAWLGMDVESVRALAREGVVALAEERP
ncbi:MAG: CoA transferase, partial [bacterium]